MPRYQKIFLSLLVVLLALPFSASAFWFWPKTPASNPATAATSTAFAPLSPSARQAAEEKYQLWYEGFERENVDRVITDQDKYSFSVPELNYIFATETAKLKKPVLNGFFLNSDGTKLSISADFKQIVKGHFSFDANIVTADQKARLDISKVRLYGFPIPATWLEKPLNKAIDDYFSFLYKDQRFQGFNFSEVDGVLKLKPEFK